MAERATALIRGTLDLLILKALSTGEKHGYAVSEWIDRVTDRHLLVEEGTLYPALHRLERRRWVQAEWGRSDNGRRAKFYTLTRAGEERLARETESWEDYTAAMRKALAAETGR